MGRGGGITVRDRCECHGGIPGPRGDGAIGEDIFAVLREPLSRVSFRANEIRWLLENAEDYGYMRIGNSWVLP